MVDFGSTKKFNRKYYLVNFIIEPKTKPKTTVKTTEFLIFVNESNFVIVKNISAAVEFMIIIPT